MCAVTVKDLSKAFPGDDGGVCVLQGIDLAVKQREIVCIVGPSGCGKTTLLNILAGFDSGYSGLCRVEGIEVSEPGPDRGFVFQKPALFPWMNVWQNATIGPKVAKKRKQAYQQRAKHLLKETGLVGFEKYYPYQISGGMAQRLQLVRVLLNEPTLLLMDEPFGALDYQTRLSMHDLLLGLHAEYSPTVLFITHDVDEALYLADRVLVMSRRPGRILEEVTIGLPRPRTLSQLASAEFVEYKSRVLEVLGLR